MKTLTIDIETTGLPPQVADYKTDFMVYPRIVSLAYKIDDEETVYNLIALNGFKIPEEAVALHGITNEMSNASPNQLEGILIEIIENGIPDVLIGHNIYFDTSIIKANCLRLIQEERITQNVYEKLEELLHKDRRVDTMRKSTKFVGLPKNKWPKLIELHGKLFPGEKFNAHCAKDDVDATYRCYVELKRLGVV